MRDARIAGAMSEAARPVVEQLEARRMLSVARAQDVLTVEGTRRADVIVVAQDALHPSKLLITVNGTGGKYSMDGLTNLAILSGAGDDRLVIGSVRRSLVVRVAAGGGNDRVTAGRLAGAGVWTLAGEDGDDLLTGGVAGTVTSDGGGGNDTIIGGAGGGALLGGDGNDVLDGSAGSGDLEGGAGDDTLTGGAGGDLLAGQAGDDVITAGGGDDTVGGGEGRDLIRAGAGDDSINGDEGDDTIDAGDGNDLVDAGEGDDKVDGGAGNDQLCGDEGRDTIFGGAGNDFLLGDDDNHFPLVDPTTGRATDTHTPANDSLDGGAGNDTLMGSHQSDTYAYDNGVDTLVGGPGNDVIDVRGNDVAPDVGRTDLVPARVERVGAGAAGTVRTVHLSIRKRAFLGLTNDVAIPAGAGEFGPDARLYAADDKGTLRMRGGGTATLGEFFRNWGYHTDGHDIAGIKDYTLMVNGVDQTAAGPDLILRDGDTIVMTYGTVYFG
jgi:Ca2+-binding RTX toxin-like protein